MLHINIVKETPLLKINLKIEKFIAITGKSGSGKTTFLRIIAGLEKAKGEIALNNQIWQDDKYFLPPQKRSIGFVFQDYALFPNMSILENLLYVNNDKKLASYLLDITEISHLKNRYPHNLSGGEKQRVALIRAIMRKPKVLLLDEPFSALDFEIKLKIYKELKIIQNEFKLITILVSHSYEEIALLTDKIYLLENGVLKKTNNKFFKCKILKTENDKILLKIPNHNLTKDSNVLIREIDEDFIS